MITFKLDTRDFERDANRFIARSGEEFRHAVADATNRCQKMAKMKVRNYTRGSKVRSGTLVNGINQEITAKGMTGIVTSNAGYSQAFEEGTRPHTIRIKSKKVLAGPFRGRPAGWDVGKKSKAMGYAVYGQKVQHPGTHPHPFLYPAWKFAVTKLEESIRKALN